MSARGMSARGMSARGMSARGMSARVARRGIVVCVEGPSAVGKTTLATALARTGAAVVPELDAAGAPPVAESAAWFVERHAAQWRAARALAEEAPFAVLDGDPFKGLWYNAVFAERGWPGVDVVRPLYAAHVAAGTIGVPALYVALDASEDELRARRAGDAARTRRSFEAHLRLVVPLRRWFDTVAACDPARVLRPDTSARDALVDVVRDAVATLAAVPPEPGRDAAVVARMLRWVPPRR